MGKTTGFIEISRVEQRHTSVSVRLKNYKEFVMTLSPQEAQLQAARCMDCGTPFCSNGCPVNNIIPDFNDLVYTQDWKRALEVLHSTNNFPELTGRICPAPCEAACTLNVNALPVGIKSIEHAIIDRGWQEGWIVPQVSAYKTNKSVAIIGSGPAGLAAAQQLARAGLQVTVFEKNDRLGGLLRYGIPDFKLEKTHIDRRIDQIRTEGVVFQTGTVVGYLPPGRHITNWAKTVITPKEILEVFDAVLLAGGAENPRDLSIPGRDLDGVHFAMEFLSQQNKVNVEDKVQRQIRADAKHVVVIGGGDTGSDCVGTSNRHGAKSVTQFELMSQPPDEENRPLTWPYWPLKLRISSSHAEGCQREFSLLTKEFIGNNGKVTGVKTIRVDWRDGKMTELPGSERVFPADLVLLAMGFVGPVASVLQGFGVNLDARGNAKASTDDTDSYATNVPKVFLAGDMRRGQSLVVWAIREGRQAARAIEKHLLGTVTLPR